MRSFLIALGVGIWSCAQGSVPVDAMAPTDRVSISDAQPEHDDALGSQEVLSIDTGSDARIDSAMDVMFLDAREDTIALRDSPSTIDSMCVPRMCSSAMNCGMISDGCGRMLSCGTCTDPETCGGAGTANRCGRPAALPYPTRSAYRIKALQPDHWSDRNEVIGNNTGGIAVNTVWALWQPSDRRPPCSGEEVAFDNRCFTIDRAVDNEIRAYSAAGVVVTAIVYGSPAWSREGLPCTPAGPGFEWFCAPRGNADFARFAGMLARRYDGQHGNGRIADFVIWNEVNSNEWFDLGCGQGGGACDTNTWITRYAQLYNAAYDAITTEQATARVLFSFTHHFARSFDAPAATVPVLSVETFLDGLAPLVAPRAWRVAYHPYAPNLLSPVFSPDDWPRVTYGNIGTIVQHLRARFPSVPSAAEVELTESGINSLAPNSSAAAQATAVCDTFRNVLGTPGIDNYIYHRMVDHPVETADGLGLGLRNADRTPKPAWSVWALANRNDLMPPMLSCGFEDLPYTRLRRSYSATRGHWASTRVAPRGFTPESSWRLWRDQRPGTVLLYECRVGQHNMLTRDVQCEGQGMLGPVGYAATDPAAGLVPLYRCRVGAGTDHFVSPDARCEGQNMEQLLGYVTP